MIDHKGTKDTKEPMPPPPISPADESVASALVDAGFQVHKALGPGLLESIYEECLCYELAKKDLAFERQKKLPVVYRGVRLATDLALDLLVAGRVVVELKAVERLSPLHEAQLLTYPKLSQRRLGFLINFNTTLFKDGVKRMVL
ncbi:MAG: GxxExxY protein [Planctomycetota bacterium]